MKETLILTIRKKHLTFLGHPLRKERMEHLTITGCTVVKNDSHQTSLYKGIAVGTGRNGKRTNVD